MLSDRAVDPKQMTQAIVRELLDYNPVTGALVWRHRSREWFATDNACSAWNAKNAGKPALTARGNHGYLTGAIFDKNYLAHRVIWLYMTGSWPTDQIDHRNRTRSDNRWCNLREATHQINGRNVSMPITNTSGCVGVRWSVSKRKWRAEITVDGRNRHLGLFPTFDEAAVARGKAERELGFSPGHGQALRPSQ